MAMQRWNPIREMMALNNAFDRMFEDSWQQVRNTNSMTNLALDVHETESGYQVVAAVPGVKADDLQINLHDNVLTITGETRNERNQTDEKSGRTLMMERSYGKFSRSIRLPQPIQGDQIEATLNEGVLTLTLPKTPEVQPRQIPVRATTSNGTQNGTTAINSGAQVGMNAGANMSSSQGDTSSS